MQQTKLMARPKQNRGYFLAPGWTTLSGPTLLGTIITHPTQPTTPIFAPALSDIDTPIHAKCHPDFASGDLDEKPPHGLFGTFLTLFGLGDNEIAFRYDRKNILAYSFRGQQTTWFSPSISLLRKAGAPEGRVAAMFRAGAESGAAVSVYMITGIKTVKGAKVTAASGKGRGWRATLGLDAEEEGEGVLFAFQLTELKLPGGGETVVEVICDDTEGGKVLQRKLDEEFGEETFTVLEGFDEANGERCRIVTPSPTHVDLLTASSARIGGHRAHGH